MSNGETSWEQPAELAGPVSILATGTTTVKLRASGKADIAASWRELTAANGRKYYYNAVTKVSMWEMPSDYAGIAGWARGSANHLHRISGTDKGPGLD